MAKRNKLSTQDKINLKQEEIRIAQEELQNLTNIKIDEDKSVLYETMAKFNFNVEYVVKVLTQLHENKNKNISNISTQKLENVS